MGKIDDRWSGLRGSPPGRGNRNLRDLLKELKALEHRKCGCKNASQAGPREPGQVLVLTQEQLGTPGRV